MKKLFTLLIVPLLALMGVNAQTDVTSWYVVNPNFDSGTTGWTTSADAQNKGTTTNQNVGAFLGTMPFWEHWKGSAFTGKMYQTLNLPAGNYTLKMGVFANNGGDGLFVYAGDTETPVANASTPAFFSVNFVTAGGPVEIGLNIKSGTNNWLGIDNVSLTLLSTTEKLLNADKTSLLFDAANLTKKFTVKGVNITENITLTAPAGITLDKTTITPAEAVAGVVVTATYNGSVNITDGLITLTSGTLTSNVTVNATNADSGCFTPLYTNRPNIISEPLMNSLTAYAGWGTKEVTTEYVYCGASSVKITGQCGGSLDYGLTGKLKPKTMYRVKVMVSTNGTGEAKLGIEGALAGGTKIIKPFTTDMGEWKALEFSFTTQATLGTVLMYINSCETQKATEIYADNWEMYELFDAPTLLVEPSLLLFDVLNPQRTFTVTGANLISDITLTAPAGITLDKTTLTAAEATSGAVVKAEYDETTPIDNDSIKLTGSSVVSKIDVIAFNGVEGCYNMLYDDKTNLVSDPLMNSLSTYGGWGNRSISSEGFCNNAGFINGTATGYPNSGSIDARITWKPFTKYRIYAMVRTENGTMTLGVSNVGLGGDKNFVVPMTNGTWQQFDETFTTGADAKAGLCFFNGYGSTGYIGYIDNWQIYELNDPNIVVDPISLDFDPQFTTSSLKVIGQNLTNDITLTAPAGITLDKYTLTATEASGAGATVNATYNVSVPVADGEIILTSGSLTKKVPVNASKYLVNPSFERDIAQGWTTNEGGMVRQSNASFTLKSGTNYAEKWISSGGALAGINLSQTVLGIPNGTYTLKASAQAIQQSDGTFPGGAFIFANANQVEVFETKEYSVDVTVTDETLNVGFKVVSSGNWVSLDNFKLISTATGLNNKYSLTGVNTFILNNRIQADINLDNTAVTKIMVYGVNGIKLAEKAVNLQAGLNRVTIDKELTRGVYLVEIAVGEKFATFKLVK